MTSIAIFNTNIDEELEELVRGQKSRFGRLGN
jgi:hypothetical protein